MKQHWSYTALVDSSRELENSLQWNLRMFSSSLFNTEDEYLQYFHFLTVIRHIIHLLFIELEDEIL